MESWIILWNILIIYLACPVVSYNIDRKSFTAFTLKQTINSNKPYYVYKVETERTDDDDWGVYLNLVGYILRDPQFNTF